MDKSKIFKSHLTHLFDKDEELKKKIWVDSMNC